MTLSQRQKAWRNIIVATTNAALEQGLFSYPPKETEPSRERNGATFIFEISGFPAAGYVHDAGWDEITVSAIVDPFPGMEDLVRCANVFRACIGRKVGLASASGWIERKHGFHIQTDRRGRMPTNLFCRDSVKATIARLAIEPLGYADHGRFYL